MNITTVTRTGASWRAECNDGSAVHSIRIPHNPSLSAAENRAKAARTLARALAR